MARKFRLIQLTDANQTTLNLYIPPENPPEPPFDPTTAIYGVLSASDYPGAVEASLVVLDDDSYGSTTNVGPAATPLVGASAEMAISSGGQFRGIVRFASGNVRAVYF